MKKIKYITDYMEMPKYFECDLSKIKFEKISKSIEKGDTQAYLYVSKKFDLEKKEIKTRKYLTQKEVKNFKKHDESCKIEEREEEITVLKIHSNNKTLFLAFDNGPFGGFAGTSEDEEEVSIYLCYIIWENNIWNAGRSIYVSKKDLNITKSKIYHTYY